MKKSVFCILFSFIFLLSGCSKSIDTKQVYYDNVNDLNIVVEFLSKNKNIREITKDNPGLFYEYPFECVDGLCYIFDAETDMQENADTHRVSEIIKDNFVRVYTEDENRIIIFQTIAKFGYGEYIIYTETGQPCSDEYTFEKTWLNKNWYTAYSGDNITQDTVLYAEDIS